MQKPILVSKRTSKNGGKQNRQAVLQIRRMQESKVARDRMLKQRK